MTDLAALQKRLIPVPRSPHFAAKRLSCGMPSIPATDLAVRTAEHGTRNVGVKERKGDIHICLRPPYLDDGRRGVRARAAKEGANSRRLLADVDRPPNYALGE